jgi:hypothetical protein
VLVRVAVGPTGVLVAGAEVAVGGSGVAVGSLLHCPGGPTQGVLVGMAVFVGATGVALGTTGVALGTTGVALGGTGVLDGGAEVAVGGSGVAVGSLLHCPGGPTQGVLVGMAVFVGATGVALGTTGVLDGGAEVAVGGSAVAVAIGDGVGRGVAVRGRGVAGGSGVAVGAAGVATGVPGPAHVREELGTLLICIVASALIVRLSAPIASATSGISGRYVDCTDTVTGWPSSTVPGSAIDTPDATRLAGPPLRSVVACMHDALRGSIDANRAPSRAAFARAL